MIFIALGTQKFQLNRLLEEVDGLIEAGVIQEEVFAQVGYSTYQPKHYAFCQMISHEQFSHNVDDCDVFITHGGVGSLTSGLKRGKSMIAYPRLAEFGEHIDDHQTEICRKYAEKGYCLTCGKGDSLAEVLRQAKAFTPAGASFCASPKICERVQAFLEE